VPFRFRRTAAVLASVTIGLAGLAGLAGVAAAGSAVGATTTPVPFPSRPQGMPAPATFPPEVEDLSPSLMQVSCSPVVMRGVARFRDLALSTYGRGRDYGIVRSCLTGGLSEHKEGRAWDWGLDVGNRAERRTAGHFLAWLTRNNGMMARRLGVMYVIYNRKIWSSYRAAEGWRAYTGASPHTDHIHVSFSWAGARGRTSFWTGRAAAVDYGPCAVFRGQMAPLVRRPNPTACPSPVPAVRRSSRPRLMYGSSGPGVSKAQRRLGVAVTGRFDPATWDALLGYQRAHDLPRTGMLDKPTWASLLPASVTWDVTAGYDEQRAARYANNNYNHLTLRRGSAGAPVAFLQTALGVPVADRNGWLGPRTAALVREFKARNGLVRNAVIDTEVWRVLAASA
jgi:hypothetical protein